MSKNNTHQIITQLIELIESEFDIQSDDSLEESLINVANRIKKLTTEKNSISLLDEEEELEKDFWNNAYSKREERYNLFDSFEDED